MANTFFAVVSESGTASPADGSYLAAAETGGPWASDLQHGGPPNALLVHAAERLARAQTGRTDLVALRLAAEFVGPVPVGAVATQARVVRAARTAVLVEAVLRAGGRDCVQARVWLVADRDTAAIAAPLPPPAAPPDGLPGLAASFPYADAIEWRAVQGNIDQPGPAVFWARPRHRTARGAATVGAAAGRAAGRLGQRHLRRARLVAVVLPEHRPRRASQPSGAR